MTLASGMMICSGLASHSPAPLTIALVKLAEPKSVSGRTPPLAVQQGASATTSAEDRSAVATDRVSVWVQRPRRRRTR